MNTDGSLKDISQSKITGLSTSLSAKLNTADLDTQVAGKITNNGGATQAAIATSLTNAAVVTSSGIHGIIKLARAAYDALPIKDSQVLYVVSG